jgi:ABC-type antimicrobial peptide transport system permease subunit
MPSDAPHPGISMHKIRVGAGVAGFIVVAGFLAIGLVGVPLFRYFLGLAIALGVGIAFGLYLVRRWRRRSNITAIVLKK